MVRNTTRVNVNRLSFDSVGVSSNGYITFGTDDTSPDNTMFHHLQLPRISGMMGDFFPSKTLKR